MSDDVDRQKQVHNNKNGPDAQQQTVVEQQNVVESQDDDTQEFEFPRGHGAINVHGGEFLGDEHFAVYGDVAVDAAVFEQVEQQSRKHRANGYNQEPDIKVVRAALAVIPSDNYDDWVVVAGALHQGLGGDGWKLFEEWSSKSGKYEQTECEKKWREEAHTFKDVTLGTIFFKADEVDPQWRQRYNREHPNFEILPESHWFGERPAPIPPALVKGILPQTGVATIGGQSGTGKSFLAIHLGVRLIPDCQQHFYIDKYRIKRKGGVLYLVLEGKPAFPLRVTAAFERMLNKQLEFGERFKLPFAWNTYAPNLFEKGPDNLLRLAERESKKMKTEFGVDLVAVFLDTMGLAACYENENMAAQVQKVVAGLNRVSDETGALSINVDHMGKDQDAGMRGTSAKRDCVETILACFADRNNGDRPTNHRMQLFKVRDGEEGRVIPYRLEQVDMGRDEDGERVTTAVVRWEPDRPLQGKKTKRSNKNGEAMEQAIRVVGLPADESALRAVFHEVYEGNRKTANMAWYRAKEEMGLVTVGGRVDYGVGNDHATTNGHMWSMWSTRK